MTCLVALIYISLVVALMLWCRNKRQKSRSLEDPENKDQNDDTASDHDHDDEKEVSCVFCRIISFHSLNYHSCSR